MNFRNLCSFLFCFTRIRISLRFHYGVRSNIFNIQYCQSGISIFYQQAAHLSTGFIMMGLSGYMDVVLLKQRLKYAIK